ncbi:hypothetical protein HA402_005529 [Bradysia odoriphaga]|nr:hypothetical protein HA402_005529 [Bradysia odoriphaga]
MDSLGKLGEIIKKAAKFLHFYNFDEKNIEEMIEDMCCMHPNEHSEAESRSIFEKILKNLTVVDQIKSCINEEAEFYIKYEQEQGSSLLPTLMQEEEITKQLEKSRFNVKKAVMAWFYRLFPRYTLQQIIKYHKKTLTRMNRMFFERNLKEAEQHQIVRIAELIIEYYEFDIKNRLDEMVEDLLVKAIHIADDNTSITPQFCKLVLRNVDINALKLRVENEFKESRDEVKDKHIKRTYRILQFKNIRNPAPKTPYPDRVKLLKRVFFDFNESRQCSWSG